MNELNENLQTFITTIDEQHLVLITICDELRGLLDVSSEIDKYDEIVSLVDKLKEYSVTHFHYEENLLKSMHYPKLFSHIVYHNDFIAKIDKFTMNYIDNNQDESTRELLSFIIDWITVHIVKEDFLYSKIYHEQNLEKLNRAIENNM